MGSAGCPHYTCCQQQVDRAVGPISHPSSRANTITAKKTRRSPNRTHSRWGHSKVNMSRSMFGMLNPWALHPGGQIQSHSSWPTPVYNMEYCVRHSRSYDLRCPHGIVRGWTSLAVGRPGPLWTGGHGIGYELWSTAASHADDRALVIAVRPGSSSVTPTPTASVSAAPWAKSEGADQPRCSVWAEDRAIFGPLSGAEGE